MKREPWNISPPTSKGKLAPGYEADFILVDRDLYTVNPPSILGTKVLETYVAGKKAFASNIAAQ